MIINDDWGGLVKLLLIVLFVVGSLVVKGLSKLFASSDEKKKQPRPGGPGQGGKSPEEALEDLFQQAKRKQREAPQGSAGDTKPHTLDDFFQQIGTGGSKPAAPAARPPVAMAVPVAKPLPAQQQPGVRRQHASRPTAAPSSTSSPYSAEAVARAKAKISEARRRKSSKPSVIERGEAEVLGIGGVSASSLGRLGPAELARAVVYAEILGKPRALSPYAGPPATE